MHSSVSFLIVALLLPLAAQAEKVIVISADGWAEANGRALVKAIGHKGQSVFMAAPAENQARAGSQQGTPSIVTNGCQFSSCPPDSPATGGNSSDRSFNYVNSYPITALRYAVDRLAPMIYRSTADLVVAGVSVGSNLGKDTLTSGTVGAASAAPGLYQYDPYFVPGVDNPYRLPGLAFSGASGKPTAWNVSTPDYSLLYAALAANLTNTILTPNGKALPNNTYLNVNFPEAGAGTKCTNESDFKWVLTRIFKAVKSSGKDVDVCNNGGRLPLETKVAKMHGCFITVSLGRASDKLDANATEQANVVERLGGLLSCLP